MPAARSIPLHLALAVSLAAALATPARTPAKPPVPERTVAVPGLKQPVEIVVDRWGVPHLFAKGEDDLFLAQGWNAARDRLFQLDLWRRRGHGELAEAFGPAYVEQDRATRLFLYRGDMDREWRPTARRARGRRSASRPPSSPA